MDESPAAFLWRAASQARPTDDGEIELMTRRRFGRVATVALALGVAGCSSNAPEILITGAGATFPYPIYAKWADAYKKSTGTGLNYQSIGSGGGIKQITAKTVDFGASDMPMKPEDLQKNGLVQFPAIMGGVVPVAFLYASAHLA